MPQANLVVANQHASQHLEGLQQARPELLHRKRLAQFVVRPGVEGCRGCELRLAALRPRPHACVRPNDAMGSPQHRLDEARLQLVCQSRRVSQCEVHLEDPRAHAGVEVGADGLQAVVYVSEDVVEDAHHRYPEVVDAMRLGVHLRHLLAALERLGHRPGVVALLQAAAELGDGPHEGPQLQQELEQSQELLLPPRVGRNPSVPLHLLGAHGKRPPAVLRQDVGHLQVLLDL
mmetsp:Transcript_15947/g.40677  ORF Transcript_15947/g.40677 Transcript_15947/m.40677 type:complete len:232 (+) Transcript_15947:143-838(+)